MDLIHYPANLTKDFVHHATYTAAVSINATLIALSLWILFSLVHFGVTTGQWSGRQKRNADKLNAGWIYTSVVVCAIIAIIRFITSQVAHNVGFGEDKNERCEKIGDALYVEYCLVLFSNYLFLWLRQRTFYINKMVIIRSSVTLAVLSRLSLFIVAACGLGVILISITPNNYPSSPLGCYYTIKSQSLDSWSWALGGLSLVLGHIMLMALLIYPLAKNLDKSCWAKKLCFARQQNQKSRNNSLPGIPVFFVKNNLNNIQMRNIEQNNGVFPESGFRMRLSQVIKKIMIRTVVFGFIAVLTDISLIVVLATSILNQENPRLRRISVTLYDMNVFLNLMFVIMSFVTWKKMMTSPCRNISAQDVSFKSSTNSS